MVRITRTRYLLPAICSISGPFFTFQQENARAHHAHKTVAVLSANIPDYVNPVE